MIADGSRIIGVARAVEGEPVIIGPAIERVLGRRILEWSPCCGTYGMGGPGFFGLRLGAKGPYPEEWLMLRLWGADDWLTVNGCWLSAQPDQYKKPNVPLHSNYANAKWDRFAPLVIGKSITKFDVREKTLELQIGDAHIILSEDASSRPVYAGTGEPRVLCPTDDLRQAWIIACKPWVAV